MIENRLVFLAFGFDTVSRCVWVFLCWGICFVFCFLFGFCLRVWIFLAGSDSIFTNYHDDLYLFIYYFFSFFSLLSLLLLLLVYHMARFISFLRGR